MVREDRVVEVTNAMLSREKKLAFGILRDYCQTQYVTAEELAEITGRYWAKKFNVDTQPKS